MLAEQGINDDEKTFRAAMADLDITDYLEYLSDCIETGKEARKKYDEICQEQGIDIPKQLTEF